MPYINKIKALSFWVFIIPILSINICLYISVNWWFICNQLSTTLFSVETCNLTSGSAIDFSFPYIDGGVSISRTARVFPTYWIFKPSMIFTGLLLISYWINNFKLMKEVNPSIKINHYFRFFGISSAIFLIIHSIFLGVKIDYDFYKIFRRFVILSFILFELIAQTLLVVNLYKIKDIIKEYYLSIILKVKIFLVSFLCIVAITSVPVMIGIGNKEIKHMLEWNFFSAVCVFYFLTFMFWKKNKPTVHTPEGA